MLELKNVILHTPAGDARQAMSFLVRSGDICVVGGASGSGKTTLVRSVMGFCRVASGYISIDGELVDWRSARTFRRQTLYIPADVIATEENQPSPFDTLTVRQLLEAQLALGINHLHIDNERLSQAWALLGLDPKTGERRCSDLTAGEMRRVLLSLGSQIHRSLVVADELTTELSLEEEQHTFKFVRALAESGSAVLLTCRADDLLLKHEENEHYIIRNLSGFAPVGVAHSADGEVPHTDA
ncbi:MAG: ABC transporter ATP-binding protein [Prevotella sp.]|jgi:ABC-type multidrug transport system ATPase subunit